MREIAIFESQKHYVQRISDDEKINIFNCGQIQYLAK